MKNSVNNHSTRDQRSFWICAVFFAFLISILGFSIEWWVGLLGLAIEFIMLSIGYKNGIEKGSYSPKFNYSGSDVQCLSVNNEIPGQNHAIAQGIENSVYEFAPTTLYLHQGGEINPLPSGGLPIVNY